MQKNLLKMIWIVVLFAFIEHRVNAREPQQVDRDYRRNDTRSSLSAPIGSANNRTTLRLRKLEGSSNARYPHPSNPNAAAEGVVAHSLRRAHHRRVLRNETASQRQLRYDSRSVFHRPDDIMRDVEHVRAVNWKSLSRNDVEHTTSTSTTTTTQANFVGRRSADADDVWGNNQRNLESRHICMQQRTIQVPVKTREVYTRPIWKHVNHPCPANQMCTRVELVHEQAYRDVVRQKTTKQISYDCCQGWTRVTKNANACMKPTCSTPCRNGGTCVRPDTCRCMPGFTGTFCEQDINECRDEKPCDQLCFNTEGSYYCQCREGFELQADKQSCRKIQENNDDAFEARDLENEIDTEEVSSRLQKIEKILAADRSSAHDLQRTLQQTYHEVDSLKSRLSTLEKQHYDFNHLERTLITNEAKTKKLEHLLSVLLKCNTHKGPYCP